jgi:hypothetical protein
MASSAFRSGDNSKARALWNVRQQLLGQMSPQYNAARAQYASDKSVENAFENGRSLLSPTVDGQVYDPHLLESRLATMSPPETQAFQFGVRKALTDTMGTARTDAAGMSNLLANDNGYRAQKLAQVIGQPQTNALLNELDNQAQMRATNNLVAGGSKTALVTAVDKDIPTARLMNTGGVAHGLGVAGAAIGGREIGEAAGHLVGMPELGGVIGTGIGVGGMMAKKAIAPTINAWRLGSQEAARDALAKALTLPPTSKLAEALARRNALSSMPAAIGGNTDALARALILSNQGQARKGVAAGQDYYSTLFPSHP